MKNQPTASQLQQQAAELVKKQMCSLLHWDDMQYAMYQWQNGDEYLKALLPTDQYARDQLSHSKMFWNWFKNLWAVHDRELINDADFIEKSIDNRVEDFYWLHCPKALAKERTPNSVVLSSIKKKEVSNV